jgi:hypothetical protein
LPPTDGQRGAGGQQPPEPERDQRAFQRPGLVELAEQAGGQVPLGQVGDPVQLVGASQRRPVGSGQEPGRQAMAGGWSGRARVKVLPAPGTLSAQIRPPWASTSSWQMASPSPLPPPARVRAASSR